MYWSVAKIYPCPVHTSVPRNWANTNEKQSKQHRIAKPSQQTVGQNRKPTMKTRATEPPTCLSPSLRAVDTKTDLAMHTNSCHETCNPGVITQCQYSWRPVQVIRTTASEASVDSEIIRSRKEASILRTETFGSHLLKARANDPPHENVWIAQRRIPHSPERER